MIQRPVSVDNSVTCYTYLFSNINYVGVEILSNTFDRHSISAYYSYRRNSVRIRGLSQYFLSYLHVYVRVNVEILLDQTFLVWCYRKYLFKLSELLGFDSVLLPIIDLNKSR